MDASQYKDYVLFMLFIKYISDKYANSNDFAPPVTIPPGAGFADMVALKGKPDIGDRIPGFHGEWEVKQLWKLGRFLKGSVVKKNETRSGDLPCIRYGEIYTHHDDYVRSFNS